MAAAARRSELPVWEMVPWLFCMGLLKYRWLPAYVDANNVSNNRAAVQAAARQCDSTFRSSPASVNETALERSSAKELNKTSLAHQRVNAPSPSDWRVPFARRDTGLHEISPRSFVSCDTASRCRDGTRKLKNIVARPRLKTKNNALTRTHTSLNTPSASTCKTKQNTGREQSHQSNQGPGPAWTWKDRVLIPILVSMQVPMCALKLPCGCIPMWERQLLCSVCNEYGICLDTIDGHS